MKHFSLIVLRNSAFGLAAQFAMKVLTFAFNVLVIRHLGVSAFGQYAAVGAFSELFLFIADLGLSPYAVREVARWRDLPDGASQIQTLFANMLVVRLGLSVLAGLLMTTAAWLTGRPLLMVGAIALNALGIVMYAIQGPSEAVLSGFERLDITSSAKVLNQIAFLVVGGVALWMGFGYYGLIVANLLGIALITRVAWLGVKRMGTRPGRITPHLWLPLLRASLPFGLIGLALGLSARYDGVLLNIFRGDAETGLYSAAYGLVFSAVVFSNVINASLYPSLTREVASAPERMAVVAERVLRYLVIISLPIAMGGWALASGVVDFLYKDEYLLAVPALRILIWVVPFMYLSEFLGYIVVINRKEQAVARAVMISATLNVALNTLLVPSLGYLWAAGMTVLTEIALVAQHSWTLRSLLRGMNWGRILLRPILAAGGMGAIVLWLAPYIPFLLNVALGVGLYGGLVLLLGALGPDDFRFLQNVRRARPQPASAP